MKYKRYIILTLYLVIGFSLLGCSNEDINKEIKNTNNIVEDITENTKENPLEDIEEDNIEEEELSEIDIIKDLIEEEKDDIAKLVNKNNELDSSYEPTDLVKANVKSTKSNILVRQICATQVEKMFNDAKAENVILSLVSGYRSYSYQTTLYNNSVKKQGIEHTSLYVAKPGQSEHQTGLAVDISSASNYFKLTDAFGNTKEGQWLKDNAHKYGFILRYTKDRVSDTGYGYEPWHFRYVGIEIATYIYENNLIFEDLF